MSETQTKKVMLVILAHPDDESFGMGGTLARYADEGVDVHYLCVTDGSSGTVEPHFLNGYDSIAELRFDELQCAAKELGLASVIMGGYRDSGMPGTSENEHPDALVQQPIEAVAANFAHHIRRLKPQVVVTHDPIGGYKHPDHIASHEGAVLAFKLAGDPDALPDEELPPYQPQKLYFTTIPKRWMKAIAWLLPLFGKDPRRFGRNQDIDILELIEAGDFPVHARVDYRAYLGRREAASACHASQLAGGPPNRGLLSWVLRKLGGKDQFMRAYPEAGPGLKENDLFEGVE